MSQSNILSHDSELLVLQLLDQPFEGAREALSENKVSQRLLAKKTDMSLGMTNAVLKRLAEKGFLTIHRMNGRNLRYALTPAGTRELARRTYRYVRRTMEQVQTWSAKIDLAMQHAKTQGAIEVGVWNAGEIAVLIEASARRHGLGFYKVETGRPLSPMTLLLIPEADQVPQALPPGTWVRGIDQILVERRTD